MAHASRARLQRNADSGAGAGRTQGGDDRVGHRVDAQAGCGEERLEVGKTRHVVELFGIDPAAVRHPEALALHQRAQSASGAEQHARDVEETHEHARPVDVGGETAQGVEERGQRAEGRGGHAGQGQRRTVGEHGERRRVELVGVAAEGHGADDERPQPQGMRHCRPPPVGRRAAYQPPARDRRLPGFEHDA